MKKRKNKKDEFIQILISSIFCFIPAFLLIIALKDGECKVSSISVCIGFLTIGILILLNIFANMKTNRGKKLKLNIPYLGLISLTAALMFSITSLSIYFENKIFKENAEETTATIYKINKEIKTKIERDENGNSYEVKQEICANYITYTINGISYNQKINNDICKYKKNEVINIHYNKNNPNEILEESNDLIFLIIGVICSIISIYIVIKIINEYKVMK